MSMDKNIALAILLCNSYRSVATLHSNCYRNFMDLAQVRRTRMKILVDRFGSQTHLASMLGIAPAYLYQMLSGRRPISEKSARKYEKRLSIADRWFDTEENTSQGPDITGLIPLISWVAAGTWNEAIDIFEPGDAEEFLPCPTSHGSRTYALRVEGDSMTAPYGKSYPPGCIIFVDPDQRGGVVNGDRVIAKLNGDNAVTFKVFVEDSGKKFLRALNPQYPSITGEFRILGRVIGKWEPE